MDELRHTWHTWVSRVSHDTRGTHGEVMAHMDES